MTEFLVLVLDFPDDDLRKHTANYHRGDVIDARVDGWGWSDTEKRKPLWRIIRTPLTMTEADFMLRNEDDVFKNKTMLWSRTRAFDLDNIGFPDKVKAWIADDTRTEPILEIDAGLMRTFVTEKGDAEDFTKA